MKAEPVVNDLKAMTRDIEEKLKDLIVYYGEDPNTIKSEEFFDIISTFSNSFEKAQIEIHEARERALKRQRQQEMQLKVYLQEMFTFKLTLIAFYYRNDNNNNKSSSSSSSKLHHLVLQLSRHRLLSWNHSQDLQKKGLNKC
ncbi:unnamed protein product [Mucor circinelloides]